jgi:Mn-dependent DtxR family transcriptional regulator
MAKTETHGPNSLSMASEDYLESIYRIMVEQDSFDTGIRSVDVAEQLEVSKASVNKAMATLKEHGMVEQSRYGRVMLTEQGREYAKDVWHRHRTLRVFLIKELGVDDETADEEACLMEHDLSEDTMRRWCEYLERQGVTVE